MNYSKADAKDYARRNMKGIWAAALNPFLPDMRVDEDGFRRNVDHWIEDLGIDGFFIAAAIVLALYALARRATGRLDRLRRVTFDNARLFWHYVVTQTLTGLLLVHGFPRLVN